MSEGPYYGQRVSIFFSDYFEIDATVVEEYGAFDVSLVNDLPLFIDPFLLFNSKRPEYQVLHESIIRYLRFLRAKSTSNAVEPGLIGAWYNFKEVKQTWLGFSKEGNQGHGLGNRFAEALHKNLSTLFTTFGSEKITKGSHLEKLCLITNRVGRDNISDFTTCLIKDYLLRYTEGFAVQHLHPEQRRTIQVQKSAFNYETESWETRSYDLPWINDDYIILTPKDMLTRDDTWISRKDFIASFEEIAGAMPDEQLRAQLNNYLAQRMSDAPQATDAERRESRRKAIEEATRTFPEIAEYYIRDREDHGDLAQAISSENVALVEQWFVDQVRHFVAENLVGTDYYRIKGDTYEEALDRVMFLKHVIESQDGYRLFYHDGKVIQNESSLQLLFKLTWNGTPSDVNSEVNNGRGPVDFKVSRGSRDSSIIEFKLAKNSKLKANLKNQVGVYENANATRKSIKAICYFTEQELKRVNKILSELGLTTDPSILLIDARSDNKVSASNA